MNDLYKCRFCKKGFSKEFIYIRHECKTMIRSREIQTAEGRMAYGLYSKWFEARRMAAPSIDGFILSSYFSQFMRFAVWCKQTKIPDPEKYISLMVDNGIHTPTLWTKTDCYNIFLEWADKKSNPTEQAAITVETLISLSEQLECSLDQVFTKLSVGDMIDYINQRKFSPWLLFCSTKFKERVGTLDEDERTRLMQSINIDYWSMKLERDPATIISLKQIASELGI